jgi:predicted ribosomally synthesized peptide with SipW-like signal peptide
MKKNLTRKLALSAAAMGVAALSVTTTTYAWFTSNSEATASNVSGTVIDAGEGNLLVSTDAIHWGKTATFGTNTNLLKPVHVNAAANTYTDEKGTAVTDGTKSYTVYFNISNVAAGSSVHMKVNLDGFSKKVEQTLLADAGTSDDAKAGNKVTVGLEDVLAMNIKDVATFPEGATAAKTEGITSPLNGKNYRYQAEQEASADAVTYYNNLLGGEPISRPTTGYTEQYASTTIMGGEGATDFPLYTLGENERSAVFGLTFTFFIDGWDYQCFSAIGGSAITAGKINFEIKTNS